MGHTLGVKVSAKGVESAETLETLRSLGCDRAQGFCISPPLPIEGLAQYLLG
ncbi:MAG: EAL domain-containing protein [Actinobacteria bacterium]|nr:EAL domain-containing protein [Actinomycetota bacterium]